MPARQFGSSSLRSYSDLLPADEEAILSDLPKKLLGNPLRQAALGELLLLVHRKARKLVQEG